MDNLLWLIVALLIVTIILLMVLILKKSQSNILMQGLEKLHLDLQQEQQRLRQDMLGAVSEHLRTNIDAVSRMGESNRNTLRAMGDMLKDNQAQASLGQKETLNDFNKVMSERLSMLEQRVQVVEKNNEERLESIRKTVAEGLSVMQQENSKKLEEMRITVDEKLQSTLEKRLSESFNNVNKELQRVYVSVGEMKSIADDVGGLKRMLGNVKVRGNLGEVQLGAILEEILSPEQYEENIATVPGSTKRVEFAVHMPGDGDRPVYLPIDAKFPGDTYSALQDAREAGDIEGVKFVQKQLKERILLEAKDIHDKYIEVPYTTDFGVLFLPFEGLFAEVNALGLTNRLQHDYHVVVAGPSTMAAMLSSLRVGFRTLAIQKRSDEVWQVLGAAKTEFEKFGQGLSAMRRHLDQTSNELDKLLDTRSKAINRKLKSVESLDVRESARILELPREDE